MLASATSWTRLCTPRRLTCYSSYFDHYNRTYQAIDRTMYRRMIIMRASAAYFDTSASRYPVEAKVRIVSSRSDSEAAASITQQHATTVVAFGTNSVFVICSMSHTVNGSCCSMQNRLQNFTASPFTQLSVGISLSPVRRHLKATVFSPSKSMFFIRTRKLRSLMCCRSLQEVDTSIVCCLRSSVQPNYTPLFSRWTSKHRSPQTVQSS